MARITHVKKAQQRYETVPVIDEETGAPKKVQVFRKDGEPKTTKRGKEIFRTLTVDDKTKPLPPRECGKCGKEITVGTPYKWIAPKSGPYGGTKLFRCGECPSWNVWEYSYSTSARIAQIQSDASDIISDGDGWESADDATNAASEIGELIRGLSEEKTEAADNIVDGFGHDTYQSDEIREVAENLESWADEVEGTDFPEFPEVEEEVECPQCGGDGKVEREPRFHVYNENGEDTNEEGYESEAEAAANIHGDGWEIEEDEGEEDCQECEGTGSVANDQEEPEQEALDAWREEAAQALQDAVESCDL